MSTPDIIVRLDESGNFVDVLSTIPLTYQVIRGAGPQAVRDNVSEAIHGTLKQCFGLCGIVEPTKEFDPWTMSKLCRKLPMLEKALKKAGFEATNRYIMEEELAANGPLKHQLHTLFRAFVKADNNLMEEYLNLQK